MKKFNYILLILLILISQTLAGEISGLPTIIDGDTIKILNKNIRLHGIDAPEKKQICYKNSNKYNCGKESTSSLIKKINKNLVNCMVQVKLDRYKRYLGICYLGKLNLNKWMVRNGYAVAYRK